MSISLRRPGCGLPLDYYNTGHWRDKVFPSALHESWRTNTLTVRERSMLSLINSITDKPKWWDKVFNKDLEARWRNEVKGAAKKLAESNLDDDNRYNGLREGFSDAMFDYCMNELRDKAIVYQNTGIVSVLEVSIAVFKSDCAVSSEVRDALRAAVRSLENVPEAEKDWHPGSNGQVVDLVHPSLWPLVYGRTRVVSDRDLTVDDCLSSFASGQTPQSVDGRCGDYSVNFQWLPTDVYVGGPAEILGYINNLHPTEHKDLYAVIEKIIDASLPLWSAAYDRTMMWSKRDPSVNKKRMDVFQEPQRTCQTPDVCRNDCQATNRPQNQHNLDSQRRDRERDRVWFLNTHPIVQPEPGPYMFLGHNGFKTYGPWFSPHTDTSTIQVIVKLATIHLTPDKPVYPGGSWHVEGQLNERICATALYYYDNDNVSDSFLAFRTRANAERMQGRWHNRQDEHDGFCQVFGTPHSREGHTVLDLGRVRTLEGRLLVFPNVLQHQVQPFHLVDTTKKGHRKILALFLVDPQTPIISTTHVPPQQQHWDPLDVGGQRPVERVPKLSPDSNSPFDFLMAKKLRLDLMAERSLVHEAADTTFHQGGGFNLCEH